MSDKRHAACTDCGRAKDKEALDAFGCCGECRKHQRREWRKRLAEYRRKDGGGNADGEQ